MKASTRRLPLAAVGLVIMLATAGSCFETGYVIQAGLGQLGLWGKARPIRRVLRDSRTDERTRALLREVVHVRRHANANGLDTKGNYEKYVELDRDAVVWFMVASDKLSFTPKVYSFPIVGSFTYLGWFDKREAVQIKRNLQRAGWDAYMRPVHAYSTGGWFRDPVLSSMFSDDDDALRFLIGTLFHELTHANILINDQSTFNESVASFVGDTMAEEYLSSRFGKQSTEAVLFREELQRDKERGARMVQAYQELDKLYKSERSDADKLAEKGRIVRALEDELELRYLPNNASLLGFKTYNAGLDEFAQLYRKCDRTWPRFFAAIETLEPSSFAEEQEEDIGPVIGRLAAKPCPTARAKACAPSLPAGVERFRVAAQSSHP